MAMTERLTDLWIEQLKCLHHLEIQLAKVLPAMARSAEHEEVRAFLLHHRVRAKSHAVVLERILGEMEEKPGGVTCAAVERVVSEWRPTGDDVQLLRTLRQAMHQEILRLARAANGARVLGYDDLGDLLRAAMEEEQYEDAALAKLGRQIHGQARRFLAA
jgi:ferritin-like metal-binding protein YciE